MSVDASAESVSSGQHAAAAEPAAPPADPLIIGLPTFLVGSIALGLNLVGYIPIATAPGVPIAVIFAATGLGMFITAVWAAALGQTMVAGIFGVFTGFWWSYAILVLGLTNNWYGVTKTADVTSTQGVFLISWIAVVGLLLLATFRLPLMFSVLLALVEIALVLVLIGVMQASAGILAIAGIVVFLFCLVGVYLFFGAASQATGGKNVPLGSPLIH